MLTALSNGISKLFSNSIDQSQFDHQPKHKINLDTTQLEDNIEYGAKLFDDAQEKYGELNNEHRSKRDVTTNALDAKVDQVYRNIVQALENNVNNQTLSSLSVEGLNAEELKVNEYSFKLFKRGIKEHNINAIKLLVAKGVSVDVKDEKRGNSILHYATKDGNLEITKYLVDKIGMDVNLTNKNGATSLHYSSCAECANFLLSKGVDINVQDNKGYTPLHYAVVHSMDTFKVLINAGADVNIIPDSGRSALTLAVEYRNYEAIKLLLSKDVHIDYNNVYGPLTRAAFDADIKALRLLLKHVEDKSKVEGKFLLFSSLYNEKVDKADRTKMFKFILDNIPINFVDKSHYYELAMNETISKADMAKIAQASLENYVSGMSYSDVQQLQSRAIDRNNADIMKMLVEIEVSKYPPNQCYVVHEAVARGSLDIIRSMLEVGVDPNIKSERCGDILKFIRHARIARVNSTERGRLKDISRDWDYSHMTPLVVAIRRGDPKVVKLLLDFNADINGASTFIGGSEGCPLDFALSMHNESQDRTEIIKLLIEAGAKANELKDVPSFLIKTDTPGVFKIAENTTGHSETTLSSNLTDAQVNNSLFMKR